MPRSGEGVEPVQGKGPTKDVLYELPAAPVLPGLMLAFEALDALEGQRDKEGQRGAAAPSRPAPPPPGPRTAGRCGPGHVLRWEGPRKARAGGGVEWRSKQGLRGTGRCLPAPPPWG